jgi:phosphatidylglycerol:prolipoprotein diacylglycerol transferase
LRQTLFHIPPTLFGLPVFGFGLLLAVWAVISLTALGLRARRFGVAAVAGDLPLVILVGAALCWVLPNLIEADGLPVRGYGVMLLLGVSAGVGLAVYRARQMGVDPEVIYSLGLWMFVAGIVGARIFYVTEYWSTFRYDDFNQPRPWSQVLTSVINVTQGGLVVYGSLIGAGLAVVLFVRKYKIPGLALADLIAPSMALGLALGRVGCFLNGCCFGGATDMPWGMTFPWHSPPHIRQVTRGDIFLHGLKLKGGPQDLPIVAEVEPGSEAEKQGLEPGDVITKINWVEVHTVEDARYRLLRTWVDHSRTSSGQVVDDPEFRQLSQADGAQLEIEVKGKSQRFAWSLHPETEHSCPIHPTQLYSAIKGMLLCMFLLAWYPFRRRDGEVVALMLTIYPVARYLVEAIRTDEPKIFANMTISQNISLVLLAGAVGLWVYVLRQPRGTAWPAS